MRALCWNGINDLRVETVPDPEVVNPGDAILRVTMSTACGSDLHFIEVAMPRQTVTGFLSWLESVTPYST